MEGYLGEIRFFAGNFAPKNWTLCQGQLLAISGYEALYSILGIEYGGDGQTNFKLPDFRGRVAINPDSSVGLRIGNYGGEETVTLSYEEMPAHIHSVQAYNSEGNEVDPNGSIFAKPTGSITIGRDNYQVESVSYSGNTQGMISMNDDLITYAGQKQPLPHNNMQPFIGLNYIICIKGNYPSRN
nr:tail fiber protein [uncultured Draconibacterium sp.]